MYSERFSYININGNGISGTGSVLVNAGKTHLHTVTVNSVNAGNVGTFVLYDGVSPAGNALTAPISGSITMSPVTLIYDAYLQSGLYVQCNTFNGNLTISWKMIA